MDDPYLYGQIASANALSDIYAMGGRPILALNIIGFPEGVLSPGILKDILAGGSDKARDANCVIAGGHSVKDNELKYGLAVTGTVHPEKIWRNNTLKPGDRLVITKPLGTGCISTALKADKAKQTDINEIVESMLTLNNIPAELLISGKYEVHACTDITGYGLAGHVIEMVKGSGVSAEISFNRLPKFSHIEDYIYNPLFLPGGFYKNRRFNQKYMIFEGEHEHVDKRYNVLFDPQTSGGLLIAMPEKQVQPFLKELSDNYKYEGWEIGSVHENKQNTHLYINESSE